MREDREIPLEETDNSQNNLYVNNTPKIPILDNPYKLIIKFNLKE